MKLQAFYALANALSIALAVPVSSNQGCSALQALISELQQQSEATKACSSLLQPTTTHGDTTSTSIVNVTSTKIITVTSGSTSTVFTFLSGNPPASTPKPQSTGGANNHKRGASNTSPTTSTAVSSWIAAQPSASVSGICSCLGISVTIGNPANPTTTTVTQTSTVIQSTTVTPAASTSSVWPCASPFPTHIPTSPYGNASLPGNFSTENSLYYLTSTKEGASAQACCNACYFDLPNCIQAYWYSYEGCVVSQATNASVSHFGSGHDISSVCPAGTFNGLTYANDTNPAFRSTGNIAGPCGQAYTNR
ncbi:hypothetical protein BGW36DRAFT_84952 [Talaromyces proteolyticus]|uniref:Apple domain-containing protein n=1 Tax=Talaromyces proteolyticus TaxID=1131652 RepID=A0AAD4Q243_9EURO|nr:uncharacterized protein BGW36DRAFT_84952 [Talaromyces proteolyticus]KAH8703292.1 hypothetical protein BGW36DRAFT_84952 [Talaromyces proteolyticus]